MNTLIPRRKILYDSCMTKIMNFFHLKRISHKSYFWTHTLGLITVSFKEISFLFPNFQVFFFSDKFNCLCIFLQNFDTFFFQLSFLNAFHCISSKTHTEIQMSIRNFRILIIFKTSIKTMVNEVMSIDHCLM